jgi:hypothetical protein
MGNCAITPYRRRLGGRKVVADENDLLGIQVVGVGRPANVCVASFLRLNTEVLQ